MAIGKIIVVANQKGGVAKTSTVRNLSYALAEMGSRVLTVDFDPQANLSVSFGVIPSAVQCSTGHLMLKVLMADPIPEKETYIQTIGKVDLIPSAKSLTVAEVNLLIEPDSDECLKTVLTPLREFYDYIIVDTGPSLGSLTINAFTAADEIIIPIDPELFAVVGLNDLTGTISKIKQRLNPDVETGGILLTKCQKRTKRFRETSEQVHQRFGHLRIFESVIPLTVQVSNANAGGLSVIERDPANAADGTREIHTLFRYHITENEVVDGKVQIHGEFQRVGAISASLQKRLLENGMPVRLLEQIAGSKEGEA